MADLNVNLLPEGFKTGKKGVGLTLANKASIGVLVLVIIISVVTGVLKISQANANNVAQSHLDQAEADLIQNKTKESNLVILKQQIKTIQSILDIDSPRKTLLDNLVTNLPEGVQITSIDIDKNNSLNLSVSSSTISAIQSILDNYIQDDKRLNDIKQVSLDRLTLEGDGLYKATLKIGE